MRELITQRKNISEVKFAAQDIVDEFIDETLKGDWPFKSETDIPFIRKFFIQDEIITKATPRQKLDAGQVVHYISTAALDRDHEIMKPSGAELKHYRKNPMVLWSHDPRDPDNIVGKNLWINQDQKGLVALTQFALANEKAAKVYNLYRDGFLRAWSVGFTPLKGKVPKKDEKFTFIMGDPPKPGEVLYVHEKWALLEYSAVGVPSNPEALTEQVAKGYELTDELFKELEINLEGLEIGKDKKTIIDLGSILSGKSKEEGKEGEEEETIKEDELEEIEVGYAQKPLPNEHACRLKDPGGFQDDSFRRTIRTSGGKKYSIIMGKLKGQTTMTEQAYRYAKTVWEASEARKHCKDHKGSFEAAKDIEAIMKSMDLEGNPSVWDIASALRAVFRKMETKEKYVYVADLYPVNYPDGHCVAETHAAGKPNKYTLYDYTYNDGKVEIKNPQELDLEYTARSWIEMFQKEDSIHMTTELYEGIAESIEGMKAELTELKAGREISGKNMKMLNEVADKMDEASVAVRTLIEANAQEEGKCGDCDSIDVDTILKDADIDKKDEIVLSEKDKLSVLKGISMDDLAKSVIEKRKGKVS